MKARGQALLPKPQTHTEKKKGCNGPLQNQAAMLRRLTRSTRSEEKTDALLTAPEPAQLPDQRR